MKQCLCTGILYCTLLCVTVDTQSLSYSYLVLATPTFRVILPKFSSTFLVWSEPNVGRVNKYDIKYTVDGVKLSVPRQSGNVKSYTVRNIADHIGKTHAVSIRARTSRRWGSFSEPVEFVFMPIGE